MYMYMYFNNFIIYCVFTGISLTEQRYYAQLGKVVRQTQATLSELHQQEVRTNHKNINMYMYICEYVH